MLFEFSFIHFLTDSVGFIVFSFSLSESNLNRVFLFFVLLRAFRTVISDDGVNYSFINADIIYVSNDGQNWELITYWDRPAHIAAGLGDFKYMDLSSGVTWADATETAAASGGKSKLTLFPLPANTQAQYLRVAATTYSSSANPTAEAENLTTSSASNTNKLLSAAEIMTFGTECKDPIIMVNGVQTKSAPNAASGFDARLVMTVKDSVIGKDVANKIALHISAFYTDTENPTTPVEIPEKVYAINKLFSSFLSGEDTIDAETGTGFALLTVKGSPRTLPLRSRSHLLWNIRAEPKRSAQRRPFSSRLWYPDEGGSLI